MGSKIAQSILSLHFEMSLQINVTASKNTNKVQSRFGTATQAAGPVTSPGILGQGPIVTSALCTGLPSRACSRALSSPICRKAKV